MVEKSKQTKLSLIRAVNKKALRDGNRVLLDSLSPEEQEVHSLQKEKREARRLRASIPSFDRIIDPEKWYPATFDNHDTVIVVPQGWFYTAIAREWWQHKIGLTSLGRHILFFTGAEVIEKGYKIKRIYYYEGVKRYVTSKMLFPIEVRLGQSRKSYKETIKATVGSDGSTKETERDFYTELFRTLPKIYAPKILKSTIQHHKYQVNKNKIKNRKMELTKKNQEPQKVTYSIATTVVRFTKGLILPTSVPPTYQEVGELTQEEAMEKARELSIENNAVQVETAAELENTKSPAEFYDYPIKTLVLSSAVVGDKTQTR